MDFFHVCNVPAAGICAAALVCSTWVVVLSALCCLRSLYHYLLSKFKLLAYTCESPLLSLNHLDCNMNIYCYYIDDDGKWHRLVHKHRYQRCEMILSSIRRSLG